LVCFFQIAGSQIDMPNGPQGDALTCCGVIGNVFFKGVNQVITALGGEVEVKAIVIIGVSKAACNEFALANYDKLHLRGLS